MKRVRLKEDVQKSSEAETSVPETDTLTLLEKIRSKALSPKSIGYENRRQVLQYLAAEGYSTPEAAKILEVSDRTIERDKKAIREGNAIEPDPKLAGQMVGRLAGEAELAIQQIRKVIRDREAPHAVKVDGHHRCFQILCELTRRLQSLGYLPTASQTFEADLTHFIDQPPSFDEMAVEAESIHESLSVSGDADEETLQQLSEFQELTLRFGASEKLTTLQLNIDKEVDHVSDTE